MNADMDDAPSYLGRTLSQKLKTWAIPTAIGTATCLGLLYLAGSLAPTPLGTLQTPSQPTTASVKPAAGIAQTTSAQRLNEGKAYEPRAVASPYVERAPGWEEGRKQTVFNDQNYIPRGAVNTVRMETTYTQPEPRTQEALVVKGIKERRRIRDFCPDPSSIEGRNCKQRWGLNARN